MSTSSIHDPKAHFILVPLVAYGHMIPMLDMARLLAERGGARVSFITTPVNAARSKVTIDQLKESHLPIQFVILPFACTEAGLPDGCENFDLLPSREYLKAMFDGASMLQEPLELFLRELHPKPSCMIADACNPWTMEVARKLQIPRVIFHGPSCFYLLCGHNIARHGIYGRVTDDFEPFVVPDLPRRVEANKAQVLGFAAGPEWANLMYKIAVAETTADGIVINSYDDLEPSYIESYRKAKGRNVWTIGPLCLCNKDVASKATRGKKASIDEHIVTRWLDAMEPGAVIYVSFGSSARTGPLQLMEIGSGLEASRRPFIWVIREADVTPEIENWLAGGFKERITRLRGLIIRGWAPQMVILSHPAVGGFLTHCGWNSILESISAGVPVITWPLFSDQFLNEKLIVDDLRIGVAVGVKVPSSHVSVDGRAMVQRDDVEKAVLRLMDKGEEGEERRTRVMELREKATKAMEEGGSSYVNMTSFIQYITEHIYIYIN